ncbi:Flp pilus assembly protein CpaB [Vibrio sinensis]|uniref:Flp pilus assembly protein CpaB n=1 Tax=Vibrio sinensis TaxID=2302434 RepID=A0A3A6Q9E4_9VIBR|nr:Flp pilus assembly protein CpaB [Vibrio sinensis]RJX68446.1 Flp pilus assembly protein CpaB [Vibrio sinensis]
MRSKLFIFIAIMAIGAGLFGVFFQNKTLPTIENKITEAPQVFYKIYRISQPKVTQGQVVKMSDFEIVSLQEVEANKLGINSDALFEYEPGSVYRNDMLQDQTVYPSNLIPPSSPEYIDLIISKNNVPYPVKVSPDSIVGGIISAGTHVDVLALTGVGGFDSELSERKKQTISLTAVLTNIKVLKVEKREIKSGSANKNQLENYLILELDRKQVAVLTIAKKISQIEIHKSIGNYKPSEIQADSGDVLPDFKAIKELRAANIVVN